MLKFCLNSMSEILALNHETGELEHYDSPAVVPTLDQDDLQVCAMHCLYMEELASAEVRFYASRSYGQEAIIQMQLEFVVDKTNPDQMKALDDFCERFEMCKAVMCDPYIDNPDEVLYEAVWTFDPKMILFRDVYSKKVDIIKYLNDNVGGILEILHQVW